jgi:peptidoglycan/LPS O-acetylase OafA/YrhL
MQGVRYRSLDSLRGIAATLVIFFHINWNNHLTGLHFFRHSFLFVDLFFILSGFIITTNYGKRVQTVSEARRFMTLRFFRLYPLHLATLLFLVGLETTKYVAASFGLAPSSDLFAFQRTIPAIFVNLAFVQGLDTLDGLSWNTPSWSISCEMIAYAVFALMGLAGLLGTRFFWLMLVPVCAGYAYIIHSHGTMNVTFDIGTIRCLCGFFLGSLIARLPPCAYPNLLSGSSVLAAVLVISFLSGPAETFVIPAFALCVYALRNDESAIAAVFLAKPLAFLGEISFSIYLIHYLVVSIITTILKVGLHAKPIPVNGWQIPVFEVPQLLGDCLIVVTITFTLAIAKLTFDLIETPGRELGYRLTRRVRSIVRV